MSFTQTLCNLLWPLVWSQDEGLAEVLRCEPHDPVFQQRNPTPPFVWPALAMHPVSSHSPIAHAVAPGCREEEIEALRRQESSWVLYPVLPCWQSVLLKSKVPRQPELLIIEKRHVGLGG